MNRARVNQPACLVIEPFCVAGTAVPHRSLGGRDDELECAAKGDSCGDRQNASKTGTFTCSRTVPENLLTGKPSICKNEHGREVSFRPFRPDESSPNPAESC